MPVFASSFWYCLQEFSLAKNLYEQIKSAGVEVIAGWQKPTENMF